MDKIQGKKIKVRKDEALDLFSERLKQMPQNTVKSLIGLYELMFDEDESDVISVLMGMTQKQLKKLSSRERIKLDAMLKRLFHSSPRMFLGTIDDLFGTNYREEFINGTLTEDDIVHLSTEAIRETFRFEVIRTDIVIKIRNNYYHIEFQTQHENMSIRMARYGLELGINNHFINPDTGRFTISVPKQAVIFLEDRNRNVAQNSYDIAYEDQLISIDVQEIKTWQLTTKDIFSRKLFNLLPVLIFKFRVIIEEAEKNNDGQNLEELKKKLIDEILLEVRKTLKCSNEIAAEIAAEDLDLIVYTLGELINYFDNVYFDGQIKELGEFDMTFTEQIRGYRDQINEYKEQINLAKAEGVEQGRELGIEQGKELGIELGRELGVIQGQVQLMYTRLKMADIDIALELDVDIKLVQEIISSL